MIIRPDTIYSVTDTQNDASWADATNINGDIVLEQTRRVYDGDGNVTWTATRQRFDNAPFTDTGALTYDKFDSRPTYIGNWYDAGDRPTPTVIYGTAPDLEGEFNERPTTVPARVYADGNDEYLRSDIQYDDAGRAAQTTDPRGLAMVRFFDALGRVTTLIEGAVGPSLPRATYRKQDYPLVSRTKF